MRRRHFLRTTSLALLALAAPRRVSAAARQVLLLQPLAPATDEEALRQIARALVGIYGFEVRTAAPVPLPRAAYTEERRRWRAERLLSFLAMNQPTGIHRILGVTAADISTTKPPHDDWGILGLGTLGGPSAVVSSFRTKKGVSARGAELRLAKMAVHEVGHTLGLEHCPNARCLMQDAQGTIRTADASDDLCARCRARLAFTGYTLPAFAPTAFWR